MLRAIATSGLNKLTCTVANHTDDPVEKAQLTVFLGSRLLVAYPGAPHATPLPPLPKWPDVLDQFGSQHAQMVNALSATYSPSLPHAAITERADGVEFTFKIGDLRPGDRIEAHPITVIAGLPTPEQVPVTLTASAMNRRGTKTVSTTFEVSSQKWDLDDWIAAAGY